MNYRAYIYTLALLGALALAAVSGGLFTSSDNVVYAADPTFDDTGTPSVPENTPPGVNIGAPVSATDPDETGDDALEFGNTLTYSLQASADTVDARAEAASFDIDASTGQLITKAPLDTERKPSYTVRVRVDDGETRITPVTQTVTITVTNEDEPPAAPYPPTVVSGTDDSTSTDEDESTTTLKVIWHEPENTGDDIDDYDVQYKKSTGTSYSDWTHASTDKIATITDLDPNTLYQVRVRAKNGEADTTENWSLAGTGSTNKAGNGAPSFDENGEGTEETLTRRVDENEPAREEVGTEVRANAHVDDNALTYLSTGPDADLFDIDMSSGQLRTKASMNHEDPRCYVENDDDTTNCFYYVTVSVFDGVGASDARPVKIEVRDRSEAPDAPARPTVRATEKSSRSLDVSWSEPRNPGPPITGYEIRYRKGTSGSYRTIEDITGTKTTIAPEDDDRTSDVDERLTRNTSYEIHVKAKTSERDSPWSTLTTGRTSAGNQDAIFDDRPDDEAAKADRTVQRTVNENTRDGQSVGSPVRARDRDSLTYKLVDAGGDHEGDAAKFDINKSTGQFLTKASLNHEDAGCGYDANDSPDTTCSYTVKVEVRDGKDEHGNKEEEDAPADDTLDDVITVQINVRDVNETPVAPKVTVTSPAVAADATVATLVVTWNKPENTGPPIDGYVVECSGAGITSSNPCPQPQNPSLDDTEVSYNITDLTPNSSYQVRVRARNAEGLGTWSTSERQSTSKAGNVIPTIATPTPTPEVSEDARSGSAVSGDPVLGDDSDSTHRLTYEIEGPNDDLFTIDTSGQIKTKKSLNHEDPRCYDDSTPSDTECTYTVRVKVADRDNGSASASVTIEVTDEPEPPSAPATPSVTATADTGRSLEVTWNEPTNTGPPITSYEIAYRKYRQGSNPDEYQVIDHQSTETKVKISTIGDPPVPLEPQTQYEVLVRATNGEGTPAQDETVAWGDWSPLRRASTGASNVRPIFSNIDSLITLELPENTRSGQNVGTAVDATDADRGNRLTYSLEGPGKDSFSITSTGQIRTRSGVTYDYETRKSYSVTVKVDDGQRKDNSDATKSVTIDVEDRDEPPSTPSAPMVVGISGSTDSVRVTWTEPGNTGPPITDYDVQCQNCPESVSHDGADRSMIITGLTPGTRYDVQVRAWNAEGHSNWSRTGTGTPNADVTNQAPIFSGGARTFSVVENTVEAGDPIGNPITAVDPDLDTVTHTLEGTDGAALTVDAGSGQIRATATLNYEEKSRYSVTVKATDTRGGSATVGVSITVTDVDEPPVTPSPPTVTTASSTSLQVTWDAPENTGPPITDYDYRYREPSGTWTEVTNTTITATTVTIPLLRANTSYDVEVRATNAEGASNWSNSGYGLTAVAGANSPPVFSEGTSATRSVSATSPAGTNVGDPVRATDADSGDTVTYSLEGTDTASFDIVSTSGQIQTKAGVTLTVGTTYNVTVVADDTKDRTTIEVTITATAAPPNNPPVFSEGASATRSVSASAQAGTSIGLPVAATDADSGDTLTYSLEGQDEASFNINSTTGQLLTLAGVTLDRNSYTVTVVASDGTASARITVTINVVLNTSPTFSDIHPTRSVAENTPAGANIGSPLSATDPDDDTLTYTLGGADATSFDIESTTGQLKTKSALDFEMKSGYSVTVTANDGNGGSDTITVTISVMDVIERPSRPAAPTVTATPDSATSLDVSWDEPDNQGPPITDYDVQYREGSGGSFTPVTHDGTATTTRITGLTAGTTYEVQVRATNDEGIGEWSASGTGLVPGVNNPPTFSTATATRSVAENTPAGQNVGIPVSATDANADDTLTYSISGADAASFDIISTTGQIQTKAALDYETKIRYTVSVSVSDGEFTDSITVTITVTDMHPSCASAIGNGANTGLANDCEALLDSKQTLEGTAGSLNWATFTPIAQWDGITLQGTLKRVTRLDIRHDGLNGSVPAELGRLSGLTYLNLRSNDLTGPIPSELGRLTNLRVLNLHSNMLSGDIPDMSGIAGLEELYLPKNMLTGPVPAWLNGMTDMRELWLWGNELSGTIPDLSGLTNLEKLKLAGNDLRGGIPGWLGSMSNLKWLIIQENPLRGTIPDLSGMTSLTYLWIHTNQLSGTIPASLGMLSNLDDFNLRNNMLTGEIPDLSGLDKLTRLRLHRNMLSGEVPDTLGGLDSLRQLWLHGNRLTSIAAELGDLSDTLIEIALKDNSWAQEACVPAALANVATNDYVIAGLDVCEN